MLKLKCLRSRITQRQQNIFQQLIASTLSKTYKNIEEFLPWLCTCKESAPMIFRKLWVGLLTEKHRLLSLPGIIPLQ
ncbi:MAG: hypothetical protein ACTS73_03850 [Arsenophonus sp. NEOnobi-MAG3]